MYMETQTLRTRLHQLRQTGLSLADLLMLDADRLDAQGWPPSRVLSDDLRSFREQISSLTSLLHEGLDEQASPRYESLTAMAAELDYRDIATRATAVARQLVLVQCSEGQQPAGLKEIQDSAAELIATQGLDSPRELIHSLAEGRHAWCDLLRMIREGDTLPDSEWTLLNTSIETAFGRPLAVSAARGRLVSPPLAELELSPVLDRVSPAVEESAALDIAALDTRGADLSSQFLRDEPLLSPVSESPANPIEPAMSAQRPSLRSSVLERAVAKSRSESSVIREIAPDVSEAISEAPLSPVAEIDFVHSAVVHAEPSIPVFDTQFPLPTKHLPTDPVEESNHSVFDEIELVSLPHKYDSPKPVANEAEAKAKAKPERMAAPKHVSSASIFEDDADEADELISHRIEVLPGTQIRESDSLSRPLALVPSPLAEQLLAQARFVDATGASARLATTILNGPESDRAQLIPDLIFHLIHEGRPGLAYHLARSLESRSAVPRPFVPSWLIRTWTLGHALVFPKGQLAGQLQDDLQGRTTSGPRDASPDWNLALSFMVRAATLRPAIIAPSTRAASVLRDFDLQPGCVQLYNYCSRIGASGERIQGVFPGLFKQTTASVPYSDQLSTLRADIAHWRDSHEVLTKKFQIMTQLFQKTGWSLRAGMSQRHPDAAFDWMNWQIALRMGESLVAPVTEDRRTELSRVRAMVEEISTKLTADESGESRRRLSQPEIRSYLRQATTFAQRWIGLHSGAATNEVQNYLPQAAVELRSDILNRHSQVMEELQTLAAEHTSFEVRMAVSCLMLSVQEIHDLVDPSVVTDTREPDPRHLLHAELLKIPDLTLTANWEPETDFHTFENEILNFLSQPQPDWTTAFQMQLAQGHHQIAERILSLTIWTPEERDALQIVLERDRGRQRTDFVQELQDVQKLLNESVHLDILQETERAGFETRLTRLQRILSTDSDISSGILELERVKDSLVKRREREADRIRTRLRRLSGPPDEVSPPLQSGATAPGTTYPGEWVMDFDRSSS